MEIEKKIQDRIKDSFPSIKIINPVKGSSGGRSVFKVRLGSDILILKLHPDSNGAVKEARTTRFARDNLAPYLLRVPEIKDQKQEFVLMEYINGKEPDLTNDTVLDACISYLARMNDISINEIQNYTNHYFGYNLGNRLSYELEQYQEAEKKYPELGKYKKAFLQAMTLAKRAVTDGTRPVITHGDFQRKNLIITDSGEIVPIDWGDFGIAHQSYAITNLIFELDLGKKNEAIQAYVQKRMHPVPNGHALLAVGMAICTIIRAGAQYRHFVKYGINDECISNLVKTMEEFEDFNTMGVNS